MAISPILSAAPWLSINFFRTAQHGLPSRNRGRNAALNGSSTPPHQTDDRIGCVKLAPRAFPSDPAKPPRNIHNAASVLRLVGRASPVAITRDRVRSIPRASPCRRRTVIILWQTPVRPVLRFSMSAIASSINLPIVRLAGRLACSCDLALPSATQNNVFGRYSSVLGSGGVLGQQRPARWLKSVRICA